MRFWRGEVWEREKGEVGEGSAPLILFDMGGCFFLCFARFVVKGAGLVQCNVKKV